MYYDLKNKKKVNFLEIRKANPLISIPKNPNEDTLNELGYAKIVYGEIPTITETQKIVESDIQLIDGIPIILYSAENIKINRRNEIIARLNQIDNEAVRPNRAIKVAELQNLSINEFDKNKLIDLENEAKTLREELSTLL